MEKDVSIKDKTKFMKKKMKFNHWNLIRLLEVKTEY